MSDIDLYEKTANQYEELQNRRPDYVGARKIFLDFVVSLFKNKQDLSVADFCCGTGNNALLISRYLLVKNITLVDINEKFLEIAKNSGIRAEKVTPIKSDILTVRLKDKHDLVVSMFAYHHVPDNEKRNYLQVAKNTLKYGGIILFGEIYSPDKITTVAYYEHLLNSISNEAKTAELEKFLRQTAESDQFEYKVSKSFAHAQMIAAGFALIESFKVWPADNSFPPDVGTFIEAWKLVR